MERRLWPYVIALILALGSLGAAVATAVFRDQWTNGLGPAGFWLIGALGFTGLLAGMTVRAIVRLRKVASEGARMRRILEDALDRIPDGAALYGPDRRLIWCNSAYRTLLDAEGKSLRAGDEMPAGVSAGVREMHGRPNRWIAVERIELDAGNILSTIHDVTAEKEMEARERTGQERFRDFLSAAGGWIWESDVLHRFTVLTPVRPEIDPSDVEWLVGRHLSELAAGGSESASSLDTCLQDMAMQRRMRDVTLWLHDGRRMRSVRLSGVPRFDRSGAFLGYRGVGSFAAAGVLPAAPPKGRERAPEPLGTRPKADEGTSSSRSRRLLLAEDSETNRLLAQSILERMGYAVDMVEDGRQAVDAARTGIYDAVLMDIWMPELDGLEATAAIRKFPEPMRSVPVVAMTAHASPEDRQRCLDAGMDEHVAKPIDRARLAEILGRLVGGSAADAGAQLVAEGGTAVNDVALPKVVDDSIIAELREDAGSSLVDELIATYMAETDDRMDRMGAALQDGRLDDIGADAHAMKSSSGTFGALRLEALAAQLEAASAGSDRERIEKLMQTLPELVSETWAALVERGHAAQSRRAGE